MLNAAIPRQQCRLPGRYGHCVRSVRLCRPRTFPQPFSRPSVWVGIAKLHYVVLVRVGSSASRLTPRQLLALTPPAYISWGRVPTLVTTLRTGRC